MWPKSWINSDVPAPVDPLSSNIPERPDFTGHDCQPIPRQARRFQHILGVLGNDLVAESGVPNVRVIGWPGEELRRIWRKNGVPGQMVTGLLDDAPSNRYASAKGNTSSAICLANVSSPVRAATSAKRIFGTKLPLDVS